MINLTERSPKYVEGLNDVTALGSRAFSRRTMRILFTFAFAASLSGCAWFGSNAKKPPALPAVPATNAAVLGWSANVGKSGGYMFVPGFGDRLVYAASNSGDVYALAEEGGRIKIALVGSSGGGSATLSSSESIIENIQKNVHKIVARRLNLQERSNKQKTSVSVPLVSITEVAFVQSKSGLDFIGDDQANDSVKLWVMESGGLIVGKCVGSLDHVNIALMIEDARIARLIHSNTIHAVITISSDPTGANKLTISAAIKKNIPIIGTGGTSLSCISTLGGNVIGCSGGSVATTGVTRGNLYCCFISIVSSMGFLRLLTPARANTS